MMKVKFTVLPEELISPVSEYCADIGICISATVFALKVRRTT